MKSVAIAAGFSAAVVLQGCGGGSSGEESGPLPGGLNFDGNLYGDDQVSCGSYSCGIDPPAIHAICVALPDDFCVKTGQPDWCSAETAQPHCVCLGAWSLYVKGGNAAPDVTCDAIPAAILSDDYIYSWKKWNGNEIADQEETGLQKLFDKCNTGAKAETFKGRFCKFVSSSKVLSAAQKADLSSHASCASNVLM